MMKQLPIQDFDHGHLQISKSHKIWYSQYGNPDGIPILVVHGGPGSQSKTKHAEIYTMANTRVILFDQRGCGQSEPQGEVDDNSLDAIIEDMEKLRKHLKIDKWIVAGGSWGATVTLAYAKKHPESVQGMFLVSVFLAREIDYQWLTSDNGSAKFYPDLYEDIINYASAKGIDTKNLYSELYRLINSKDNNDKKIATKIISDWEGNIMRFDSNFTYMQEDEITDEEMNKAKIFLHFDHNNYFLKEKPILENAEAIKNIPTFILHGRYDMVCPVEQAYLVHRAIDNSTLEITNYDNHYMSSQSTRFLKYYFRSFVSTNITVNL
jgi:proline iminopeptidase